MPIGYNPETGESKLAECIMITKDFNFVDTEFYLEYMVDDPVKYLYASSDPEATLKMLAQSYIRDTVGVYNVDDVITTGKAEAQVRSGNFQDAISTINQLRARASVLLILVPLASLHLPKVLSEVELSSSPPALFKKAIEPSV